MNNQPIGVLDSGVGGLSIWKEIISLHPNESTIYIADSRNCPYGIKSEKEIYRLAQKLVQFLVKKKVKLIILACNTITVSCLDKLRKDFPKIPIIGTVPVIKTAINLTRNKRIGILSTLRTSKSKYQKKLLEKFAKGCRVINKGTDKLVPLIEKGEIESEKILPILKEELEPFIKEKIDVLALGCSHFPLIRKEIEEVLGKNVLVLDSGAAIARQVERVLKVNKELAKGNKNSYVFYTTGQKEHFKQPLKHLMKYNKDVNCENVYALSDIY